MPWRLHEPHHLLSQLRCCLLLPTPHADMAQLIWLMLTAFWGCLGTPDIPSVLGQAEFRQ